MRRQNILLIILFISIIVLVAVADVRALVPAEVRNWDAVGRLFSSSGLYKGILTDASVTPINPHAFQDSKLWINVVDFFRGLERRRKNNRVNPLRGPAALGARSASAGGHAAAFHGKC